MAPNTIAAAAVVLAANAAMLGLAAWNRSASPEATLTLTEREYRLPYAPDTDNTGLGLQVAYVDPAEGRRDGRAEWFDREKLEAMGFDCRLPLNHRDAAARYARQLPRRAFVVLEFEGDAWRRRVEMARERRAARPEAGREAPARESEEAGVEPNRTAPGQQRPTDVGRAELTATRLTVVDAGGEAAALRRQYPDRHRFLVVRATVRMEYVSASSGRPARLAGRVVSLWPGALHVPKRFAAALAPIVEGERARTRADGPRPPRYTLTVNWGRRLEPWVTDVRKVPDAR